MTDPDLEIKKAVTKNIIVCNVLDSPAGKDKKVHLEFLSGTAYPVFKLL